MIGGAAAAAAAVSALAVRLRARGRELENANRRLQWFIKSAGTARHDLRTPMTAIIGFATLLRDRNDRLTPEKRQQYLSMLLEESGKLNRLIEALLKPPSP